MRQPHARRLFRLHDVGDRLGEAVGRVGLEQIVTGGEHFVDLRGRQLLRGGARVRGAAEHEHLDRPPPACCAAAIGSQLARFSAAVALFGDDQDHMTRASSRSARTSAAAASWEDPSSIRVCLVFSGT